MAENLDPQRSRLFTWTALRAWLGLTIAGAGIVLLWVGWYRVSGETLVAAQLPYIASASVPGAALLIAGVVLAGSTLVRQGTDETEELVATLVRLLTEPDLGPSPSPPASDAVATGSAEAEGVDTRLVTIPDTRHYHRPQCLLVEGKPDVRAVDEAEIARLGLEPCPVCNPPPPGA